MSEKLLKFSELARKANYITGQAIEYFRAPERVFSERECTLHYLRGALHALSRLAFTSENAFRVDIIALFDDYYRQAERLLGPIPYEDATKKEVNHE